MREKRYCTLGWDFEPTTCDEKGMGYNRDSELMFNKQYYPTGAKGEWPIDPVTGEKLEIWDSDKIKKEKKEERKREKRINRNLKFILFVFYLDSLCWMIRRKIRRIKAMIFERINMSLRNENDYTCQLKGICRYSQYIFCSTFFMKEPQYTCKYKYKCCGNSEPKFSILKR